MSTLALWRFVAARASIFGMPDRPWQSRGQFSLPLVVLPGSSITRSRKLTRRGLVWFVEAMWGPVTGFLWRSYSPGRSDPFFLFDHTGALIAANDNWKQTQQTQIQATGWLRRMISRPRFWLLFSPGAYTAFLQGRAMTTGIALAQVYDVDPNVNAQPTNLSARAFVGTGNDVLIGGTIIGGNAGSLLRVLVRALGPSLASVGVATPLANPTLSLRDASGNVIASMTTGRIRSRERLR
jgi:hypothetical protein